MLTKIKLREIETKLIFSNLDNHRYSHILEVGAGACSQTPFLHKHCDNLTSTDLDAKRFDIKTLRKRFPNINFVIADAEAIDQYFPRQSFDIVFASYLIAHLPNKNKAISAFSKIVKNDGLVIFVMPNRLQKILHVFGYYPYLLKRIINKIIASLKKMVTRNNYSSAQNRKVKLGTKNSNNKNNLGVLKSNNPFKKFLLPIHGHYNSQYEEWKAFGKKNWVRLINNNGLKVEKIINLKVVTGNFNKTRYLCDLLEKLNLSSSNAYLSVKQSK